jgi:hypothetical protein
LHAAGGADATVSQSTATLLFHPPHRRPSLQAFPPDIQEKTIKLLAALLRVHASSVFATTHNAREARDE